jgi:hypothetical protein
MPLSEEAIRSIWEQASAGVFTEHGDCPATYACSSILTELVDAGYCGNCFVRAEKCKAANERQAKCCPDCTHSPAEPQ